MAKKYLLVLALVALVIPFTSASADTSTPAAIGSLSQMLGIDNDQIQAELAAGKTAIDIAVEHGMKKEVYLKRAAAAKPVAKVVAKKTVAKTKKAVKKTVVTPAKKAVVKTVQPIKK